MQAILTKFLCATNVKGSRIKATCERGSITLPCYDDRTVEQNHITAAQALVDKFVEEDKVRYGTHKNPWSTPRVAGTLPSGDVAHVFKS